jgi:hypothetical protein
MTTQTPRYITLQDVKIRLIGKVEFDEGTLSQNDDVYVLSDELLIDFICQAESEVEVDLSKIYTVPFVTFDTPPLPYLNLAPTALNFLRKLFITKSCLIVMDTEYGNDTGVKGQSFIANLTRQYDNSIKNMMKRTPEGRFETPPVYGLSVNNNRFMADKVLSAPTAMVLEQFDSLGYANSRMTDPSRSIFYPVPRVL